MNEQPLPQQVVVTDVQMRFGSMVLFMVKWAIAAIPALVILIVLGSVLVALGTGMVAALRSGRSQPVGSVTASSGPAPVDQDRVGYREKVLVQFVKVGISDLGYPGVFGEVKNTGDRTLKEVEITIYCLGADGKPVLEKTYYPVLGSSFGDTRQPLKPGYSRKFGVKLDDAPSDWTKKVEVKVTGVEFQ